MSNYSVFLRALKTIKKIKLRQTKDFIKKRKKDN